MPALTPFDPLALLLIAVLNPAVIAVGFLLGRSADQWQKVPIAGFIAALAGSGLVFVATLVGLVHARGLGGEGGLFVMHVLFGIAWATIGFCMGRRRA